MTPEDISQRLGPDHVAWILQRPDPHWAPQIIQALLDEARLELDRN